MELKNDYYKNNFYDCIFEINLKIRCDKCCNDLYGTYFGYKVNIGLIKYLRNSGKLKYCDQKVTTLYTSIRIARLPVLFNVNIENIIDMIGFQ